MDTHDCSPRRTDSGLPRVGSHRTDAYDPAMGTRVRVTRHAVAFGGWKGSMDIDGAVLRIVGDDPGKQLDIDCSEVKRYSFNSNNGLWALRMRDGRKLYVQMSGHILSADRSPESKAATQVVRDLLRKLAGFGFSV